MAFLLRMCDGTDFAYRLIFIWKWVFTCVTGVLICMAYREWNRLGGDESYRPPAPWLKEGTRKSHRRSRPCPPDRVW